MTSVGGSGATLRRGGECRRCCGRVGEVPLCAEVSGFARWGWDLATDAFVGVM